MEKEILFYKLGDIENMSTEENNRLFVKLAQENMYKGQEAMDKWLTELADDYICRCGEKLTKGEMSNHLREWKNNTIFIIDNKSSYISQWCDKYHPNYVKGEFKCSIV